MSRLSTLARRSVGVCALATVVHAGGPAPENRAGTFTQVCKNSGAPCDDDTQCPGSTCIVRLVRGSVSALVTVIVDDNVSTWAGTEQTQDIRGATMLVEVRKNGTHLIAQILQNVNGADLDELVTNLRGGAFVADSFNPVTEADLNETASTPDILGRFLFQSGDVHIAQALREITGQTGQPVVIAVPRKLEQATHTARGDQPLASVLRVKVKIGFAVP